MGEKDREGLWGRLRGRFGEVARRLGFVGREDVEQALDHQKERKATRQPHKKIGRILVEGGKMADSHVGEVLKEQKKGGGKVGKKSTKKASAKKKAKKRKPKAGGKKAKKKAKKKSKKR